LEGLRQAGVEIHLDAAGDDLLDSVATLVKSPGIPGNAPAVAAARRMGIPVIGELELGWRMTSGSVIAVTGTNGKTTTTELIGHILRAGEIECAVVGNVGRPISSLAATAEADSTLVVEASSFQLEDSDLFAPETAVMLGVTPDHLDRHGSLEAYRDAKLKIFANQTEVDTAIVPSDFEMPATARAHQIKFNDCAAGIGISDGAIVWRGEELLAVSEFPLPGAHNLENAQAAAAACLLHGVAPSVVADALRSFSGVPHRLETVIEAHGVIWINDSKATNVASTVTALRAMERPVRLILGGQGKGQDFSDLAAAVEQSCVAVHLIGEAAGQISQALDSVGVSVTLSSDLETAVAQCGQSALEGDAVLLSPACASFDQFTDFEERGAAFRKIVAAQVSQ
jgi:UDP-N-acetylmuramoylalanine--D-glutamate ligase